MDRTNCIIGIGERSASVNAQIRKEIPEEELNRLKVLSIDYCRDSKYLDGENYVYLEHDGTVLYDLDYYQNTENTNSPNPLMEKMRPVFQAISQQIDELAKYNPSGSPKVPRMIVHSCLNLDHPEGLSQAVGESFVRGSSSLPKPKDRVSFSRNVFFTVLRFIEDLAQKKKVKIEIFPVVLFRTSFTDKEIITEKEKILPTLLKLHKETKSNPFFRIGYIIQDTNSRNNTINLHEHISLLYLHILVLANITHSIQELDLQNDNMVRHVLFELDQEPTKQEQRWCSLGFIDGVLKFKTLKQEFAKYLAKEALDYILKEEESNASIHKKDDLPYTSMNNQLQLESLFLSLLSDSTNKGKPSATQTLKIFNEKVNSRDIEENQVKDHNILGITSGAESENKTFAEYLKEIQNLKEKRKPLRDLPKIWGAQIQTAKPYIQKIRDMAKDFLQPTRMREIDAHVKKISKELIHDFRLFCTVIASGDLSSHNNQEFYNKELETFVHQFFSSIRTNYTWKYLRESLQKSFRIFQYEVYNKSLSAVNKNVLQVENLRDYDLSGVEESHLQNKDAIEAIPHKKAIAFFFGIFALGLVLTNLHFLFPMPYLRMGGILSLASEWIVNQLTASRISSFTFLGYTFFFKDWITPFFIAVVVAFPFLYVIQTYKSKLYAYKAKIQESAKLYQSKVQNLFREMFQINLNLKLSGLLMEYINEMEKSFVRLNDFETRSRELTRKLEKDVSFLYDAKQNRSVSKKDSLKLSSFMGLKVHSSQLENSIIVDLLKVNLLDTMDIISTGLKYNSEDTNKIKKYLLRFDKTTEECFRNFEKELQKDIQFDSLNTITKSWKYSTIPPNVQSYIPLKTYTTDFELNSFPTRDYEEREVGSSKLFNSFEDHHIVTMFYPIRKFRFREIYREIKEDIQNSLADSLHSRPMDNSSQRKNTT